MIQLAKSRGAIVYANVGSAEQKRLLIDAYRIPEEHIFYSRDASFAKGIKRVTNGRGVDVVINTLVGDKLLTSLECVAPHGRFVEMGEKKLVSKPLSPYLAWEKKSRLLHFMRLPGSRSGLPSPVGTCTRSWTCLAKENLTPPYPCTFLIYPILGKS